MEKSNKIVAEKIIKQLLENKLLPQEKKQEWLKKFYPETVSYEDWSLLADFYIKEKDKTNE